MTEPQREADRAAIRASLLELDRAWREGRYGDIGPLVHESVTVIPPGFRNRVEGRAPYVESYREFGANAKVEAYSLSPPTIEIWGDTAVATSRYEMTWDRDGRGHSESGHDVLVLSKRHDRWCVVWRTLIPSAKAP